MASNGFSVALGNADIDFNDGTETHGFLFPSGRMLVETRASTFAQGSGEAGTTYVDAEPFNRQVWEEFGGGFGQAQQNRTFGGTGQGGDPKRYYASNGWTRKGNILLPGMARNIVSQNNTHTLNDSDIPEVPRGVLPSSHPAGAYTLYSPAANVTFQKFRVLVKFFDPDTSQGAITITGTVQEAIIGSPVTFSSSAIADYDNYTEYKWVTLTAAAPFTMTAGHSYDISLAAQVSRGVVYGCFVGRIVSNADVIQPYFQLISTINNRSFRNWTDSPVKVEQIITGTATYNPVAITPTSFFLPNSAGIPERTLGATYVASMVFNNQLYIGEITPNRTGLWSAADAIAGNAATQTTVDTVLGPAISHEGMIYYIEGVVRRSVLKWDGVIPAVPTTIIAQDKIGDNGSNGFNKLNNIILHKGHIFLFKPEGVFWVFHDPSLISTAEVPRILKVVDLTQYQHQDNGKWCLEMQGQLYFNVRNTVIQLAINESGASQQTWLSSPRLLGRLQTYQYVNGLATNGDTLFISYANIGVEAWAGGAWHPVTDFYEQITADSIPSGIRWLPATPGATDMLYVGDGNSLVKMPIPSLLSDYSTQFYLADQNKCFYHITSIFDGNLAEIKKYLRSFTLRAFTGDWRYKLVAAMWTTGTNINYRNIVEKTLNEGLHRDRWIGPQAPAASGVPTVVKKILDGSGNPTGTNGPCNWVETDFLNAYASAEKFCSDDDVAHPVQSVSCAFILYGWQKAGDQSTTVRQDMVYLESMILKYLPVQNYLPRYSCSLDIDASTQGEALQLDQATLTASLAWLRGRIGAKTPTNVTFKDMTGATKTVMAFIDQHQTPTEGQTLSVNDANGAKTMELRILPMVEEYTS